MQFRLELTVRDVSLHEDGVHPLNLVVRRAHDVRVTLSSAADGDQMSCVAETDFEPSRKVVEAFEHLADGRLPPGHVPREQWPREYDYIDAEGRILGGHIVPRALMPESLRTFSEQLSRELHDAAQTSVGLLRWRSRTFGPRSPFASRGTHWSLDAKTWRRMPSAGTLVISSADRVEVSDEAASEFQALLDAQASEPLGHELLREAWAQRWENPRSSLLIGIAALEVGLKEYIAVCVPEAAWLATEAPTPPVVRIMREYIPMLDPPNGEHKIAGFDDELINLLRAGVEMRNRSTHKGAEVSRDRLVSTLLAVRDILWELDAALGYTWAAVYKRSSLDQQPSTGYRRV